MGLSFMVRVRPFFQVLLYLGLLTLGVNCVLQAMSAASILKWPPKVLAGNGFLEENRRRVANVLEEYSEGKIAPDEHLGVFVGISNLREDVDLKVVDETIGTDWRFLGLGGAGFALPDIGPHAEALLASQLRPDLVILGFGLHQLVDTRPKPGAFDPGFIGYVRRGDWRNTAIAIRNWLWFYARRQDVTMATESSLLDARDRVFHSWNVRIPEPRVGRNSPWREMVKADWPEHFSSNTLREQEQFFEDMGIFDARTYANSPKAAASLVRIVERFRQRGAKVTLLVLPQHSLLSQRIPANAADALSAALHRAFPDDPPPLIDLRAVANDDGFVDLPHLNRKGSATFSRLMAEQLRPHLPTTAPLMKAHTEAGAGPSGSGHD